MGAEPIPAETAGLSTSPPRILQFRTPIRFITIPDTPGYQVVQTLSPVIRLPLPNTAAAPTYIFGELNIHMHFFICTVVSFWVHLFNLVESYAIPP